MNDHTGLRVIQEIGQGSSPSPVLKTGGDDFYLMIETNRVKQDKETTCMFQTKAQGKTSIMEISNIPGKQFRVMVKKFLRRMVGHSESFKEELGNVRKYQIEVIELKNMVSEVENKLEGSNNCLGEAEEMIRTQRLSS